MASTAPFSIHLMGGFELLYERSEEVLKSTSEMGGYFKKLAEVELEYSKSLIKLNQATKKLFGTRTKKTEKEVGTLKDCWDGVQAEVENIANRHSSFAGSTLNDVAQAIAQYVKQKEQERKRLVDEGRRITKEYRDTLAALKKAQGTYESKCKEAERAHGQHEKAKAEGSMKPKEIHKLASTAAKCMESATAADSEYQKMIQKANSRQQKFHELEMPQLLRDFQSFEEDRIRFLKTILGKFHSLIAEFPPFLQTLEQSLNRMVTAVNVDTDIKSYAEGNRTNFTVPSDIRYEPYVPENPSFAAVLSSSAPASLAPVQSSHSSTAIPASQAKATSTFNPAAAAKADPASRVWGLSDDEQYLSRDEKVRRLKDQLVEVKNAIRAETKSKKGLEKLVKFYTSDPVAQDKARGELEEQNRKISLFREGRNKIQAQLTELGEYTAPDNDGADEDGGDYSAASQYGGFVPPPPPPPACLFRCRGLYDYTATNDTELSFREGDILNITERDDSGWWYAELNGVMGFIPNNYVETID